MSSVKVYNQTGQKVSEINLNEAVFGLPWNADLVHQAVRVATANQRQVVGSAKTREEVSGGGRKPWRQKGTGRARHGSIRSPLWRGGGVAFGPTSERNFKLKINKKMAKRAFLTVLSGKAADNEILVLEELKISTPKTKEMAKIFSNFPDVKNGLLILKSGNDDVKKAGRNLPKIKIASIGNLNILDILKHKDLIFTREGVEFLTKKYVNN